MATQAPTRMAEVRVRAEPGPWPAAGPLPASRVALLIVDMQVDFVEPDGWLAAIGVPTAPMAEAVAPIERLLDGARRAGVTVVHTRQGNAADLSDLPPFRRLVRHRRNATLAAGDGGPGLARGSAGWEIVERLRPAAGELVIDKLGFNAFAGTSLAEELRERGIEAVAVTGVTSNVCVLATVVGAVDAGFEPLLVRDAVAADDQSITQAVLRIVDHEGPLFGARADAADVLEGLTNRRSQ